jgi:4-hydroxy-4-methyl-2-oxoglutarate aldolase
MTHWAGCKPITGGGKPAHGSDPGMATNSLGELARRVRTADVVDAMGRLHHHRSDLLDLVSPTPGRVLFGPAVTISYFPSCRTVLPPERYNFKRLFYEAIGDGAEGCVLVLASNGYTDTSLGGGTKLSRVQNHRLAGILTDGRLRDFAELRQSDLAIYCRGEATRWGGDVVTPFEANRSVVVAGVGIHPGDYIFADHSGAVAIPANDVRTVLQGAWQVTVEDAESIASIRNETPSTSSGEAER